MLLDRDEHPCSRGLPQDPHARVASYKVANRSRPRQCRPTSRQRAALKRCLRKVPSKQRRVLRAYYDGGRSLRDVGLTCGMNANAVAQLLFRIRAALRTCILERLAADA